jgi:hypothetical protein
MLRAMVLLGATIAAYHYSLQIFGPSHWTDTLGFLAVPPILALLLAAACAAPTDDEPDIHDRQLDYIIGVPLIAVALSAVVWLPGHLPFFYWTARVDLLSVPLFLAGSISLLFGVRATWRLRPALAILLLAWPLPYWTVLAGAIAQLNKWSATATVSLIQAFVSHTVDDNLELHVSRAAQGLTGPVAILFVAAALASLPTMGGKVRVLLCLIAVPVLWGLHVAWIWLAQVVGQVFGAHTTAILLHPTAGGVVLALGVLLLMGVGAIAGPHPAVTPRSKLGRIDRRRTSPSPAGRAVPVPRAALAVSLVATLSALLMHADGRLERFHGVGDAFGRPRIGAFTPTSGSLAGWSLRYLTSHTWAQRYLGQRSTWRRYQYEWVGQGAAHTGRLRSSGPILADVVTTASPRPLLTYGPDCCYSLSRYRLADYRTLPLGDSVDLNLYSYCNPSTRTAWTIAYWEWPVRTGQSLRFERVTLSLLEEGHSLTRAPPPPPVAVKGLDRRFAACAPERTGLPRLADQAVRVRAFLIAFAQASAEIRLRRASLEG